MIHTFETRLRVTPADEEVLTAYCAEWSRGWRTAYAAVNRGDAVPLLYRRLTSAGFTAHQAGSLAIAAQMNHAALGALKQTELKNLHTAIYRRESALTAKRLELAKLTARLAKLTRQRQDGAPMNGKPQSKRFVKVLAGLRAVKAALPDCARWIRGKETVLRDKRAKAGRLAEQIDAKQFPLCFGSNKLLAQRPTPSNADTTPFESVDEWRSAWRDARDGQVWSVGKAAKASGNPEIQWDPFARTVRIRLTDTLAHARVSAMEAELGMDIRTGPQKMSPLRMQCRFLELAGVDFPSHDGAARAAIVAAQGERPVTLRLLRRRLADGSLGFYLQASVDVAIKPPTATRLSGVLGIDLNAGGAAWCLVKPDGNRLVTADGPQTGFLPWDLKGKTAAQREAILSEAASTLVGLAAYHGFAVALEGLDFANRRAGMKAGSRSAQDRRYNAMLSSFAMAQFGDLVERKCARAGVALYRVQPQWSSVGGFVKYGAVNGLNADEAASLWLARQALYGLVPKDVGPVREVKLFQERVSLPHLPVDRKQRKKALAGVSWGTFAQAMGVDRRRWGKNLRLWKAGQVDQHGSGTAATSAPPTGIHPGAGSGSSGAGQARRH